MQRVVIYLIFFIPVIGFGWSGPGHELGGAIAYYYLKKHQPEVIPKVVATLQYHPWMKKEWAEKLAGLTEEEKEVGLFMLASTFPDEARDTPYGSGEKSKWHYINYPYSPDNTATQPPQEINAEKKLIELQQELPKSKDAESKAIDLCWFFHILEDIHQPLHTTALFDASHISGDKGGNTNYISFSEGATPLKLHTYWDRLIKGTFANIPQKARDLLELDLYQIDKLPELSTNSTVSHWIEKESLPLAISVAYQNGKIRGTPGDPYFVDKAYAYQASQVAEKQVVLCGIRLARELQKIYSKG